MRDLDKLGKALASAVVDLVRALADGQLTAEEVQAIVSDVLDDAVGGLDGPPIDLDAVLGVLRGIGPRVADLVEGLQRDPARMRARADRAEEGGHDRRALRLRARAVMVERRREAADDGA